MYTLSHRSKVSQRSDAPRDAVDPLLTPTGALATSATVYALLSILVGGFAAEYLAARPSFRRFGDDTAWRRAVTKPADGVELLGAELLPLAPGEDAALAADDREASRRVDATHYAIRTNSYVASDGGYYVPTVAADIEVVYRRQRLLGLKIATFGASAVLLMTMALHREQLRSAFVKIVAVALAVLLLVSMALPLFVLADPPPPVSDEDLDLPRARLLTALLAFDVVHLLVSTCLLTACAMHAFTRKRGGAAAGRRRLLGSAPGPSLSRRSPWR